MAIVIYQLGGRRDGAAEARRGNGSRRAHGARNRTPRREDAHAKVGRPRPDFDTTK